MKKFLRVFLPICLMLICIAAFSSCSLLSLLDTGEKSAEEIYELISPSVVAITAESPTATSSGTGFFYNNGSTIVTNYHVIEDCQSAYITLPNGQNYDVLSVLGYDKDKDIAILKVDYEAGKPLTSRDTEVKTGETVYAIGNSLGFLEGSLSEGIVSTAKREIDGYTYIQTTAAVTHGNSGGPLIDAYGKIIGIVSAGFGDGLDLNLAIPVSQISTIDTNNPKNLHEIINVKWISHWRAWHQDDQNRYVLVFTLADGNKTPVATAGSVIINIKNDYNETVYQNVIHFDVDDFLYWSYDNGAVERYQATIYIEDNDITRGYCSSGKLEFSVVGKDYVFDESMLTVDSLPQKSIYNDTVVEKTVYTAQELVDSINHNRKIILGADYYDLSNVDVSNNKLLSTQLYGSKGFVINNVYNLSIEGTADIVIGDLAADVLCFANCSKLNLDGLTVGHFSPSNTYTCEGAVIEMENCRDVTISNCKLFGCGSVGITANTTTGLTVKSTEIYDCTFAGVSLWKSSASFENCKIYDLPYCYSAIFCYSSTMEFSDCSFIKTNVILSDGNKCFLDVSGDSSVNSVLFDYCTFTDNTFANIATKGATNVLFKDCAFVRNNGTTTHSGVKYQNCFFDKK